MDERSAGMRSGTESEGAAQIVAAFAALVKESIESLSSSAGEADVRDVELRIRSEGLDLLRRVLAAAIQRSVGERDESCRSCPNCGDRRRHKGVRSRTMRTTLGPIEVRGIYWRCEECGTAGNAADDPMPESLSMAMRECVHLAGTAATSFDRASRLLGALAGVAIDADTVRRRCLGAGSAMLRTTEMPKVEPGGRVVGSCDGTMVRTRETGWRELKSYRFDHAGGKAGGAFLESSEDFAPRLAKAAQQLGCKEAGEKVFISDLARWIGSAVREQLPGWLHIGDYWHVCQHVYKGGAAIYGETHRFAGVWSRFWCRRLLSDGAARCAAALRDLAMLYREAARQRAVLDLAAFFDRHSSTLQYPQFRLAGLPIGSGPMESLCNQMGLRMKGPGKRWSKGNVTSMAMLVNRFALTPDDHVFRGVQPAREVARDVA